MGRIDIHIAIAQHAGLCDGGGRIYVQVAHKLMAHLMVTSTGVGLRSGTTRTWITLPMVTPSRVTGAPSLDPGGILKVGAEHELMCKQPACGAGHEKDEPDQHGHGHQHQRSHSQLRPLNLFSAWHRLLLLNGCSRRLEDSRMGRFSPHFRGSRWPWQVRLYA